MLNKLKAILILRWTGLTLVEINRLTTCGAQMSNFIHGRKVYGRPVWYADLFEQIVRQRIPLYADIMFRSNDDNENSKGIGADSLSAYGDSPKEGSD